MWCLQWRSKNDFLFVTKKNSKKLWFFHNNIHSKLLIFKKYIAITIYIVFITTYKMYDANCTKSFSQLFVCVIKMLKCFFSCTRKNFYNVHGQFAGIHANNCEARSAGDTELEKFTVQTVSLCHEHCQYNWPYNILLETSVVVPRLG